MHKAYFFQTHIEIHNYRKWDAPNIEKLFSVFDQTYHRYYNKGLLYDQERKILMLPRGVGASFIQDNFGNIPMEFVTQYDEVADIGQINLKYKPRDDLQYKAISFLLDIDKNPMLSLNLNTGKGKTYCAIAAMAFLGVRTMVITDSINWLKQWKDFIIDYTDIKDSEIYLISGTPSLMKLFKRDISKYKVILSTHSTIQSVGSSKGWNTITEFFQYMKIGLKIFDEAHLDFDNMFMIDCYTNTLLTYYLTATPDRSDWKESSIYGLYFRTVPMIDLYDRSLDAHTKYAAIQYNSNPTPQEISDCRNKYGLDRNGYTNYVVNKPNFYELLHILLDKILNKPGKALIYIGTNQAIMIVRDWIYANYPELIGQVGIYTSLTPIERKAEELDKKIIISTTKSAGAAMDIKNLVETINLAEPFKSKVLAQQTFGRTRDNDTIYKDIVDIGFYYTKKYYDYKKPTFAKYATTCQEVMIKNQELHERAQAIIEKRENMIQPMTFDTDS